MSTVVNFEIPAPALALGLTHIINNGLVLPETLRALGVNQWSNDAEPQYAFAARVPAGDTDRAGWNEFCALFSQQCVGLYNGTAGECIGPVPWAFDLNQFTPL